MMISKKQLVKKLHSDKGLDITEISDLLEESETEISNLVETLHKYKISTSINNYTFYKLTDKDYYEFRKESLPINQMYMFTLEMDRYLSNFNISGIPEIYSIFSCFFGQSSNCYDDYKSSFNYPFLLKVYSKDNQKLQAEYIVSINDIKGSMEVSFYKIAAGRDKEDYDKYHQPFPELSEREMKKIWFWFMAFVKNALEYIEDNNLVIKSFCRRINYSNTIYGYKEGEFFAEELLDSQYGEDYSILLEDAYEKYKEEVYKEIKENNYINKSSEFIFEVIQNTNENSLPSYEYDDLKIRLFKAGYNYFSNLDYYNQEQVVEKAESLSSMLLSYFALKDEYHSNEEYFKKSNDIENFGFLDFENILEKVERDFKKNNYTDEEVYIILRFYREAYKEGRKEISLKLIGNLLFSKFEVASEKYKGKLARLNKDELEILFFDIVDIEDVKELEEYLK